MTRSRAVVARELEVLYLRFNQSRFIHPDPLEFVHRYESCEDREVAAFIAQAFSFGRVASILKAVDGILQPMGPHPAQWLRDAKPKQIEARLHGFVYRWVKPAELADFLHGLRRWVGHRSGMGGRFAEMVEDRDRDFLPALQRLRAEIFPGGGANSLFPDPASGGASKRLHMFLRWMVRKDEVDPGCWHYLGPARLLVPVDVHMKRVAARYGFSKRAVADLKCAREITAAFARLRPDDPVRYDFCLTRQGIWGKDGEQG